MEKARVAFVSALAIMLVLSALLLGCSTKSGPETRGIAATVNGDKIYFDEVNEEYASLTPEQKAFITKADALSFLIERQILYQEAVRQGFSATDEELNGKYEIFLSSNNLTQSKLHKQLAARNSSVEKFKISLRKEITISKLLDSRIPRSFVIKHEEAEAVYNASTFRSQNISFDDAQERIVDFITEQRRKTAKESYIAELKDKAQVLVVGVPD